jgi:histidinol dehydrogenase
LSTPWRKAVRDFWHERTRTLLVVLAIALGISGFAVVLSTHAILTRELNQGHLASNPASATLRTDSIDAALLNRVRAVVKERIVGPGNAYVAAAKRQVYGQVGIDMVAGPSEVVVIADRDNDPAWIALDLLAQAEHDEAAQAILVTDDADFGRDVGSAVEAELAVLPRAATARASWRDFGAVIVVTHLDEAPAIVDRLAPEHLEIATGNAEGLAARVTNAGAIFIGRYTPEVIGDYVAGSNHVLPTARSARFASGLSVLDFMKRTSILKLDAESLAVLGPAAMTLAEAEGLDAHRRSVAIRLNVRD